MKISTEPKKKEGDTVGRMMYHSVPQNVHVLISKTSEYVVMWYICRLKPANATKVANQLILR